MTDIADQMIKIASQAKKAARSLATISGEHKAAALNAMVQTLQDAKQELLTANTADLEAAKLAGITGPILKRLEISDRVFAYMQNRLTEVAALPDPVGRTLEGFVRPNGLQVSKITVPIGVIGIIYESRPNVTSDAASVCLKSSNAVILRGGSESLRTNIVLAEAMIRAATATGIPEHTIQIIRTPDREAVHHLLQQDQFIDVLIPRGGKSLIERISNESRIPVIKHYDGICHQYLASDAATDQAISIAVNSKCQRVEVCNALETLLVDEASAARLLPALKLAFDAQGVTLRGCAESCRLLPGIEAATKGDWSMEYLAPILSLKVIPNLQAAIDHINTYGSGHTDGIVTNNMQTANAFVTAVDSGSVLVNASTRLSGGGDYGLGAVVGISTDKLHARGPVGPQELTSYKWVAYGNGHLRD
ncbi:glutamate-5-semialdehyde dehydrogenase [bacterium M21]|nr:glutamate-5-semialdehyde dehydrogenase [bacterium M21]